MSLIINICGVIIGAFIIYVLMDIQSTLEAIGEVLTSIRNTMGDDNEVDDSDEE